MTVLEDFVEYLILGSVALLSSLFAIYVIAPQGILVLLQWLRDAPAAFGVVVPFMFFLGLIFHYLSYAINRPLLHRRLLRSWSKGYENLPRLCNSVRGEVEKHWSTHSESEKLEVRVGDALEWGRFFLFQHGSNELRRQNIRVFHMYRVSYGSFFPLLLTVASGLGGLFIPGRDKFLCASVAAAAVILLVGSYVASRNLLRILWRYLAYSTEVLVRTRQVEVEDDEKPKARPWPLSMFLSSQE
jgi:hypothetical protein